jgi:hypothetical protein
MWIHNVGLHFHFNENQIPQSDSAGFICGELAKLDARVQKNATSFAAGRDGQFKKITI